MTFTRTERKRGCGLRKPGGLYLVADGLVHACQHLPIPLHVCPTCGEGVKQTRGWTWIEAERFIDRARDGACRGCPIESTRPFPRSGLLWVGQEFYKTPEHFEREADELGVSRRIAAVPRGFQVGETWVFLAHKRGADGKPGIFRAFKPCRIEYVLKGDETEDQLKELEDRGITPTKIKYEL